ncbi:MAG: hypothetical protein NXH75_11825 [Halobacteriovoraceae bacterium]|nr:hypothetical protein [Halobacteriovoraceae bacterium]
MLKLCSKMMLVVFFSSSVYAQMTLNLCQNVGRATTTDQKSMSHAIAKGYLGLKDENILTAGTSEYVSWKLNQKGCLADIVHYALVTVVERKGEEVCETTLDLHTKDYFVDRTEFEREFKPRNVKKTCALPEGELAERINKCDSMGACPRSREGMLTRDILNGCACTFLYDRLDFEEVSDVYSEFFNPNISFDKPEGLNTPF